MDNDERRKVYAGRVTPARARRLKHKESSRKTHSHAGLLLVHLPSSGRVKRVPCHRCAEQSRKGIRIGGS